MVRALLYILAIVAAAAGLSWLADRPGDLVVNWQGYEIQTSVFRAIVLMALLAMAAIIVWSIARQVLTSPATVGHLMRRRRQERGLEALSAGIIAVGSGDRQLAGQYAKLAHRSMPNEPLTHLLRAQSAQLSGDRATARRIYESMRNNPETELLGLRGLYLEAQQENEPEAARQYAERAVSLNPRLGWSVESLFAMQCKDGDWQNALDTLAKARRNNQVEKAVGDRRRAVLLTAQAAEAEETDAARALALAVEAHGLAPDLVPAAAIAGRLLASQGATPKAARILQRAWRRSPHPDLAAAYAFARIGDSPRDRLKRIRELASLTPHSDEGQIAVAVAAIDAQDWEAARRALRHLADGQPSQRVCTLMARIEGGQHDDTGKVREWLARAVHAARDPAWIADGHVSSRWAPISPVTGVLDAYAWQTPVDTLDRSDSDLLIEQLVPAKAQAPQASGARARTATVIEADEQVDVRPASVAGAAMGPVAAAGSAKAAVEKGLGAGTSGGSARVSTADAAKAPFQGSDGSGLRVPAPLKPQAVAADGAIGAARPSADGMGLALSRSGDPSARDGTKSPAAAAAASGGVTRMLAGGARKADGVTGSGGAPAIDPRATLLAPDDPGPDAHESDEAPDAMTRFRAPATKASH